jgi:hypothetical protein
MRRTPLPRTSSLACNAGPNAKARKPKRARDTGPDKATVIAVLERDGWQCVKYGGAAHGRRGVDYSVHHRKLRSQGGDNGLANLITLCGSGTTGDHGWCHANPAAARDGGWIVRGVDDPLLVPVAHFERGLIFLFGDGSWSSRPLTFPDPTSQEGKA